MARSHNSPPSNSPRTQRQTRFLTAFSECGSILRASRSARIDRTTHYVWMRKDPTYPQRFREAVERTTCLLEDEAVRRAHEGLRKPVLYRGRVVRINGEIVYEHTYSDTLLIRLLKTWAPDKYKRRVETTVAWDGDLTKLPADQLEKVTERMLTDAYGDNMHAVEAAKKIILAEQSRK
jgi:hypothetical protein